jgi:hypothetical protein
VKFDANGNVVWERVWGGRDGDDAEGVAVDSSGTVFLAGSTASFGVAPDDAFLVKFLSNGRAKEAVTWGGGGLDKGHDATTDVALTVADPGGTVVTPNGTLTYAGRFDAALLRILP